VIAALESGRTYSDAVAGRCELSANTPHEKSHNKRTVLFLTEPDLDRPRSIFLSIFLGKRS